MLGKKICKEKETVQKCQEDIQARNQECSSNVNKRRTRCAKDRQEPNVFQVELKFICQANAYTRQQICQPSTPILAQDNVLTPVTRRTLPVAASIQVCWANS